MEEIRHLLDTPSVSQLGLYLAMSDLSPGGWVMVLSYYATAALSYWAMRSHQHGEYPSALSSRQPLRTFWLLVLCTMVLLGINKQMGLQFWLAEVGRDLAQRQGWYASRQSIQTLAIATLTVAGLLGLCVLAISLRRALRHTIGAVLGLSFLVTFVAMRAVSLHQIDVWLGGHGLLRPSWMLEVSGIALVAFSAGRAGYKRQIASRVAKKAR